MKRASVYSQRPRLKRLRSDERGFFLHPKNPQECFMNRDDPDKVIDGQLRRVCSSNKEEFSNKKPFLKNVPR